jgi:hypothetical protein
MGGGKKKSTVPVFVVQDILFIIMPHIKLFFIICLDFYAIDGILINCKILAYNRYWR